MWSDWSFGRIAGHYCDDDANIDHAGGDGGDDEAEAVEVLEGADCGHVRLFLHSRNTRLAVRNRFRS